MAEYKLELINQELTCDGFCVVNVSLAYPVFSGIPKKAARRINSFYRHNADALLKRIKKYIYPAACAEHMAALEKSAVTVPDTVKLTVSITHITGDFISLYREITLKSSRARKTERYGDAWYTVSGLPVPLCDFIPEKVNCRRLLTGIASEIAGEQMKDGSRTYFDGYKKVIRKRFSPDNFYITSDGLEFFYNEETIAPRSEGIPVFAYHPDALLST